MDWLILIGGIFLIVIAYLDILQTAIEHQGAGILSNRLGSSLWTILLWLAGKNGRKPLLNSAGLIIVTTIISTWIVLIWIGYTMVFTFQTDSIVHSQSRLPADVWEKLYYTGFSLSTLGVGDFVANGNLWRVITIFLAVTGLIFITLSITYLIPLLSAVTNKRKISIYISMLGKSPEELILNAWNGKDLAVLNQHFNKLMWQILDLKEKHLLYPVLHYFHSSNKWHGTPITLSLLDEALTIILSSDEMKQKMDIQTLKMLRISVNEYLDILDGTYIYSADEEPPLPELTTLNRHIGLDIEKAKEFIRSIKKRRRLLNGMLQADGWTWNDLRE